MVNYLIIIFIILISKYGYAYLGPGVGGGFFVASLALIIAIFAALFALIWFPLKRLIKKINRKNNKKID